VRVWGVSRPPPVAESREANEWQRSARNKAALPAEVSAGHRNRIPAQNVKEEAFASSF